MTNPDGLLEGYPAAVHVGSSCVCGECSEVMGSRKTAARSAPVLQVRPTRDSIVNGSTIGLSNRGRAPDLVW